MFCVQEEEVGLSSVRGETEIEKQSPSIQWPKIILTDRLCRATIDGVLTPPCERCKQNNLDCVIGTSNRGGRRVRKRTLEQAELDDGVLETPTFESSTVDFATGQYVWPAHCMPDLKLIHVLGARSHPFAMTCKA